MIQENITPLMGALAQLKSVAHNGITFLSRVSDALDPDKRLAELTPAQKAEVFARFSGIKNDLALAHSNVLSVIAATVPIVEAVEE